MIEIIVKDLDTGEEKLRDVCDGAYISGFGESMPDGAKGTRHAIIGTVYNRNIMDLGRNIRELIDFHGKDKGAAEIYFEYGYYGYGEAKLSREREGEENASS